METRQITIMDSRTLAALKSSIAHWERLATGKRKHNECVGVDDCSLCGMFNKHKSLKDPAPDTRCNGCPVFEHTGERFCKDTPFDQAQDIAGMVDEFDEPLDTEMFKEAAQKELEFLESLLPKENS